MVWLRKPVDPDGQARIKAYLKEVSRSLQFSQSRDPIHDIINLVKDLLVKRGEVLLRQQRIQDSNQALERRLAEQHSQHLNIQHELGGQLAGAQRELSALHRERLIAQGELRTARAEHTEAMKQARLEMTEMKEEHAAQLHKRDTHTQSQINSLTLAHTKHTNKLARQLLVNQNDDMGWPDEKLQQSFTRLRDLVDSITSIHRNKELRVPRTEAISSVIDPTGFTVRNKRGQSHLVMKSRIWTIISEEFFSVPFGFGALGSSQISNDLLATYRSWLRMYVAASESGSYDSPSQEFRIFYESKLANKWRSATFSCVREALQQSDTEEVATDNVDRAVSRIEDLWTEIAQLSGQTTPAGIKTEIRSMVQLARDMAVQFGVHPAQLRLFSANPGDQVELGQDYRHYQNGDRDAGSLVIVDLVLVPGLQRIGDGFRSMDTKWTIEPCEIVPGKLTDKSGEACLEKA
ncbi:hypothetical protein MMC25_006629 [Agyrium rufum]|nr:hypothetical protein [Agyrium rufum]